MQLQHERFYAAGTTEQITKRFLSLPGADPLDHRQNRCVAIIHSEIKRSGSVKQVDLTLIADTAVVEAQSPDRARLEGMLDFGKGLTGVIVAEVDFQNRTVTGTYAQAGTEYRCSFNGITNTLNLQPLH
jgi:hypothetical protein